MQLNSKTQTRRNFKNINPKNTKKSPIHENTNAKITCDFGDERVRIAAARLEKDIFVDSFAYGSYSSKDVQEQSRQISCKVYKGSLHLE